MYTMILLWFVLINIMIMQIIATQLGARCQGNMDCSVSNAHCDKGVCACQPYYAQVDNTTCLESTLLGSECVVSEQCTLKVAYSACLEGVCRCTDGHLQFRKHTCLSPAPPGHVCYSNEHCRLWDKESRCEFVILNLFGRCTCNSYFKQSGDKCVSTKLPTYVTEAVVAEQNSVLDPSKSPSYELSNKYPKPTVTAAPPSMESSEIYSNDVLGTDDGTQLTQETPNAPKVEASKRLPISIRKDGEANEVIRGDDMIANLHANDQPIYRVVTQPSVEKKSYKKNNSTKEQQKSHKTGHQKKSSLKDKHRNRTEQIPAIDLGPASLGMLCVTDSQCQEVDPYTRCFNKRCDCTYRTNSTSACSARNRGCMPGTFQCRSTGACISWYFVCDGRKDCPDGSDEKCQGTGKDGTGERCPINSFRCGGPGSRCVSRASRCDGTPQCPDGEDERNCKATRRKGCPRHTFRCGSGECLPEYEFCNAIISCKDASDEPPHLCNEQSRWRAADFCPLRCGNGRCRSTAVACSGRDGCGDNSDEIACTVCKCPPPSKSP